jgi:hypothetical protein
MAFRLSSSRHDLCEQNVHPRGYMSSGLGGSINGDNSFTQCMVAHGWSLQSGSAASPIAARATPAELSGTPDVTLCQMAVDRALSQWEAGPAFADAVAEAKRRGLTVDRCQGMF